MDRSWFREIMCGIKDTFQEYFVWCSFLFVCLFFWIHNRLNSKASSHVCGRRRRREEEVYAPRICFLNLHIAFKLCYSILLELPQPLGGACGRGRAPTHRCQRYFHYEKDGVKKGGARWLSIGCSRTEKRVKWRLYPLHSSQNELGSQFEWFSERYSNSNYWFSQCTC